MEPFSGTCEIVEEKDEVRSSKHSIRYYKAAMGSTEYDIDKLFQSITVRNYGKEHRPEISVSEDGSRRTSPLRRNHFKTVITAGTPRSPRIGQSDSVSLKQALRDLCISKASEIASHKRVSKSTVASPRISEAEKIETLYNQVLIESDSKSRIHLDKGKSSRPEENKQSSSRNKQSESDDLQKFRNSGARVSSCRGDERNKVGNIISLSEKDMNFSLSDTVPRKETSSCKESSSSATKNSKKVRKVTRNIPRPEKKILLKKKVKVGRTIAASKIEEADDSENMTKNHLFCHRCHCELKNNIIENDPSSHPSHDPDTGSNNPKQNISSRNSGANCEREKNPTSSEKFEFSLSSKDSLGDYSRSTSISEESSISRLSCGNKPHMSMDARWEAIKNAKSKFGVLGLRNFNLLKKLGCGDIGTVYLAELIDTNCVFAIKVMDNEFLARREKTPRIQTEKEILKMLDHPFLPTLYSQFTSDNLSCLVMEYCPGGDLHVLRQRQLGRCFPQPAARFYVAEVLLALEYLHMLGVIYRDLKPENILVQQDGHIMLTDFDLSLQCSVNPTLLKSSSPPETYPKHVPEHSNTSNCIHPFCAEPAYRVSCFTPKLSSSQALKQKSRNQKRIDLFSRNFKLLPELVAEPTEARSNSFVGTHEYLAPEIIKGVGHGAAVDWWTFGILLYELLYGKTPFKGRNNDETLANILLQNLKFPESPLVSFQAKDIIRGLLVKEPENRLGSRKGAAEIKRHQFFEGLNWALIRCAVPPELPDLYEINVPLPVASPASNDRFLECKTVGDHLEFELF